VISGYCSYLLEQPSHDANTREMVGHIAKAGERAATLTRQLLAFSRKQIIAPNVLDLNALVAETEKMLDRLIGEDIHVTTVLDPGLGRTFADPAQIEQVILNLAVNARDAMAQGGDLTIATHNVDLDETLARQHPEMPSGPYVLLAIRDTGCGMDEQTRARIFEPFFTTKDVGRGTGLGLASVYGSVKQSGGFTYVDSRPGRGTEFAVYLPRIPEAPEAEAPVVGADPIPRGSETVLLVEDFGDVRKLESTILRGAGYTVLEAQDGIEALGVSKRHAGSIHLLVTDVVMPKMSGRQVADLMISERPDVKVLYLSGYTNDAIIRHGVEQAGTALLQKPFTATTLANKVRQVLDSARPK
jgi:CheY-like chemotaxis protein